jgi:integrase
MQGKRTRALDSRGRPVPGLYVRDGRFMAGFKVGGRWTMRTLGAETLTEARRERESLLARLREGRIAPPRATTVRELFRDWQNSRTLSPRTCAHEEHVFRCHFSGLAERRAQGVTTMEIARVLQGPAIPATPTGAGVHVLRLIRGMFAHAIRRGILTRSPADRLAPSELPRQRNARAVHLLDAPEIATLVAAGSTERWRVALGLAGLAGLRLGELRALRWRDIDLDAGTLNASRSMLPDGSVKAPKTAAGTRTVPLVLPLRRLLVAWRLRSPHTQVEDLVLCTADGGPVQERSIRRALEDAKQTAGLRETDGRLSMHALRHSYCSVLATAGLPPTTLARITGHSDPGFTLKIYARDGRDEAVVVADVLSRAAAAGLGG